MSNIHYLQEPTENYVLPVKRFIVLYFLIQAAYFCVPVAIYKVCFVPAGFPPITQTMFFGFILLLNFKNIYMRFNGKKNSKVVTDRILNVVFNRIKKLDDNEKREYVDCCFTDSSTVISQLIWLYVGIALLYFVLG
ncbi:hypothetical protein [Photobacterium leiognathi]|uniref:hypothetical protein n=1 Tax=Photobacterium leiognathi TaxID=553611 RepID=UPI00298279CC|nr:hypothetical protein [Photobacterium leiognathi]